MSHAELAEYARSCNARARQYAQELSELRSTLGIEPGAPTDGVETELLASGEAQNGNVDTIDPRVQNSLGSINDLVREAVTELLPGLLREALPRQRGIAVFIPGEGRAVIPADEVVARTYSAVVDTVAQLAAASKRVPVEDGYWAAGVEDETASLLAQVALASPRRPKSVSSSRSV